MSRWTSNNDINPYTRSQAWRERGCHSEMQLSPNHSLVELCLRDFLKLGKLRNAACAVATGALSG